MARKASPRITRPSGIQQSANGNYFYWKCNVSGKETFADNKRFADIVANYGSEEALFKEYVLGPAKKYLSSGFDIEAIKAVMEANGGHLPRLEAKGKAQHTPKQKRGRKPKKTTLEAKADEASPEAVLPEGTYPWSNNPDYFKSVHVPLSAEEATKDACAYPNRYLDDACYGCSIYAACVFKGKYTEKDWKSSKVRNEVKIKKLETIDS